MVFEGYCKDPFWDANLTWRTELSGLAPDFTDCFEKTVLSWFPSVFLWTLACFEVHSARSYFHNHSRILGLSWLLLCRSVVLVLLITSQFIVLVKNAINYDDADMYPVDVYTYAIRAVTFVLALSLCLYSQSKGKQSSGIQFVYWTLVAVCEGFGFRTNLINGTDGNDDDELSFVLINVFYPLILAQLLLNGFGEPKIPRGNADEEEKGKQHKACPEPRAPLWSRFVFAWFDPLVWRGYRRPLQHSDLYDLNPEDKSDTLYPRFTALWKKKANQAGPAKQKQKEAPSDNSISNGSSSGSSSTKSLLGESEADRRSSADNNVSVLFILWRLFWPTIIYGTFCKMIQDGLSFVHPEVLKYLLGFVDNTEAEWKGYLYTLTLFFTTIAQFLLNAQYLSSVYMVGLRTRSVLTNAVYQKGLRKPSLDVNVGQIIDLVTFDVQALVDFLSYMDLVWSIPLHVIVSFYFLWKDFFGPAVLAGFGLVLLILPIQFLIAQKLKKLNARMLKLKDTRLKLTTDVLNGIKTVKLNTLECELGAQVSRIREQEIRLVKYILLLNFTSDFFVGLIPLLATVLTFITFVLLDENNVLDASRAFLGLIYFAYISFPLSFIPSFTTKFAQVKVSLRRLTLFLNSTEIQRDTITYEEEAKLSKPATEEDVELSLQNASFAWRPGSAPTLHAINLRIKPGSLIGIVGERGSGKSSLLHAIMGEMHKISGTLLRKSGLTISYMAQQPWIQNATIRGNIILHRQVDEMRYEHVLQACALKPDLKCLPAGDGTEIGEKGSTLSGGQKSRVALGRAAYADADMYLLDHPLSSVDSFVGKSLFDNVIGSQGLLRKKTRVIATNQVVHFPKMDLIVFMKDGHVQEIGTYEQLLNRKGAFFEYLSDFELKDKKKHSTDDEQIDNHIPQQNSLDNSEDTEAEDEMDSDGRVIEIERPQTGIVKFASYAEYVKAAGWASLLVMALHFGTQLLSLFSNRWLTKWTEDADPEATRNYYLGGYTGFALSIGVAAYLTGITLVHGSIRASLRLHLKMFNCVLTCPMWFFDSTPIGRIMNRFSGDMTVCDFLTAANMKLFFGSLITLGFDIYVITSVTPLFIVVIAPAALVFTALQRFYITTWRHVTRLEAITKSPILAWIQETLNSVASTTIRVQGMEPHFIAEMKRRVDHNLIPAFAVTVFRRSLKMRVEMLANLLFLSAAIFTVWGRDHLSSALVGLSITYARNFGATIISMMQWLSDMETNAVSMERIKEYTELSSEESSNDLVVATSKSNTATEWPARGVIRFLHFQTHYRKRPQPVLKDVYFNVEAGEKICIVGRTGAGKSSLALSLFRILNGSSGAIEIDGENIANMSLWQLRHGLNMIPQDPALFNGTIRSNLDPFQEYTDDRLWHCLELAQIRNVIEAFPDGLYHRIETGGADILSLGQLQLFYLGRALLRKSKILILDEATSAIDLETDKKIQQMILEEFGGSTVLAICHRLNHIVGFYDKVIVMDQGELIEHGSPAELSKNPNSVFHSMLVAAGLGAA